MKLSQDCISEWAFVTAGVPQETKKCPWLFLIVINEFYVPRVQLWKYVDDITMSECVGQNWSSDLQSAANELTDQGEKFDEIVKCKFDEITVFK